MSPTHEVDRAHQGRQAHNGVAVHPDGKRVFVSSGGEGTVQVIDTATNTIVAKVPVGKRPWNMAMTPGRQQAVRRVRPLERRRGRRHGDATKVAEIAVGELPWGVAIR